MGTGSFHKPWADHQRGRRGLGAVRVRLLRVGRSFLPSSASYQCRGATTYRHTYAERYTKAYSYPHSNAYTLSNANGRAHAYLHRDFYSQPDAHCFDDANPAAKRHAHAYRIRRSYAHTLCRGRSL